MKYGTHSSQCRSNYITTKKHICIIITGTNQAKQKTSLYQLDTTDDLPSGIMPLAVGHKMDHKYPKLLKIPMLNMEHDTIHILRTIIGNLQPIEIEDFEVSNNSWTTDGTADTTNSPAGLPSLLHKSSFQPEHNKTKHSIV